MLGIGSHRECCWREMDSMGVGLHRFGAGGGVAGALHNSQ
jgi:hypothetical protein